MHLSVENIDIYLLASRGRPAFQEDGSRPDPGSTLEDGSRPDPGSTPSRRSQEIALRDELIREAFGPEATLVHDEHGAPSVASHSGHISISHSRDTVALAVSPDRRIGIDIEQPRDTQLERVKERFATAADSPTLSLLQLWTAKEAVYKAAALPGLSLTDIVVTPTDASIPDGRTFSLHWENIKAELLCLAY